ncbi:alpha/beta fold hydrolase [Amylibacter sp. SFDW26]|uniref:alpha/beta fold hydrolase n=1 Tax=Amylibacter sp. SFDW26 TaxID=2652722 RepID=UPI0012619300|nr:alpha/beta fold hydrolase [Amylibacter sp. SFDW26]KAB7614676.1 alpha/beta fold hydrolase [Amylibacter sp. SFDW26]
MTQLLNTQVFGDATEQPTLLIAHGLFGSGRNWRAIARRFSVDRKVITVDMRNHAGSFWDDDHSYHALADDLGNTLSTLNGPVDLLGHSMGGKAAMVLALRNPGNLNRLLIADIAPIAYAHSQISNIDIMRSLDLSQITRRSEADVLLQNQLPEAASRAFLLQSLELSENGNRWALNLDALANSMDDIVGFPSVSGSFNNQTLFIKGGASDYILSSHMGTINALFPNSNLTEIPNAAHWVHAENPRAFIEVVADFLGETI